MWEYYCVCVWAQGSAPYVSTTCESNTDGCLPSQLLILCLFFSVPRPLPLSFFNNVIFHPSTYLALIEICPSLWFLYDTVMLLRCFKPRSNPVSKDFYPSGIHFKYLFNLFLKIITHSSSAFLTLVLYYFPPYFMSH